MKDETILYPFEQMEEENSLYLLTRGDVLDTDVKKTADICVKNNTLSPIIKLELKCKLQLKRLNNGQNLDVDTKPKPIYKMSSLDIQRRNEMKNRNKIAAKKYRDKQRVKKAEDEKTLEELATKNFHLKKLQQKMVLLIENLKTQGINFVKEEPHP